MERPSRRQRMPSLLSWGTTSVMMGMGGRYLLSRLAVRPAAVNTSSHAISQPEGLIADVQVVCAAVGSAARVVSYSSPEQV